MAHPAREINDNPLVILEVLYDYVSEHTAWISLLLGENGTLSFINSLNDVVRSWCIDHWMEIFTKKEAKTYDYFCSFIVSGCVALVNDWLNSGMKESAEEMAILSRDIIRVNSYTRTIWIATSPAHISSPIKNSSQKIHLLLQYLRT